MIYALKSASDTAPTFALWKFETRTHNGLPSSTNNS